MKLGTLLDHSFTFFRTLFRAIDVFLNLPDWMICSYIFSRYFVCFESNDSKYTLCSSLDDNRIGCKFFISITSDCNRLEESVFSSIIWLCSWCGKRSGIMRNCFLVNFQIIGNNVLVFLCGYLFLSSLLYTRCLNDFSIYWTLWFAIVPYFDLHTLLNFLFSYCDFHCLSFFFNIDLCGPTLLGFSVGRRTTLVKTTSSNRSVVWSIWLGVDWSRKLRIEWSLCIELIDKWLLFISNLLERNWDGLNLVDRQIILSWQLMLARSIRVCLQGEGDVYYFFSLTVSPSYVLLDGQGLCRRLCCLKEWHLLCWPDLQFRRS